MSEDQLLDQPILGDEEGKNHVFINMASGGKRFANFIIDTIIAYVLVFLFSVVFAAMLFEGGGEDGSSAFVGLMFYVIWYVFYVIYYWAMESLTGKTVGKYITRTKIVKEDGSKPENINILGRSLCRLIPFEAFSYLGSESRGWHDTIPKIYVIND